MVLGHMHKPQTLYSSSMEQLRLHILFSPKNHLKKNTKCPSNRGAVKKKGSGADDVSRLSDSGILTGEAINDINGICLEMMEVSRVMEVSKTVVVFFFVLGKFPSLEMDDEMGVPL